MAYAFSDWIRERQMVVSYENVSSSEFTLLQLELMLKKAGDTVQSNSDFFNNKDITRAPDPWNGKLETWRKKK